MTKPTLHAVDPKGATVVPPDTTTTIPPDPFDLTGLRLSASFLETAGVKKLITTVPVHKPGKQDFVRVHPEPAFRENVALIELKDDRESYVVHHQILSALLSEVRYSTLFTAINRQGVVFLWPVTIQTPDIRRNAWHDSARDAAEMAMGKWLRLQANMTLGAYEIFVAEREMADPVWPELTFPALVKIAFRDRIIADLEHPVVKRLRGQA